MSEIAVKTLLESMGSALRVNRLRVASVFFQQPELFFDLLKICFETDYKLHHKAMWTIEMILEKDLDSIIPHIDYFTQNIHKLKHESAIRPTAKICKWIAEAYVKKHKTAFVTHVKPIHIERIVETGFDWMITETKVAAKAYTMDTLYYFGCLNFENYDWIHHELKNIVLQNSSKESSAYKAHGRQILGLMNDL